MFPRWLRRRRYRTPRSPLCLSGTILDLVPRGNKRFRRGEQQESFVTLMTRFFGQMGNSARSLSIGQKLPAFSSGMKYL